MSEADSVTDTYTAELADAMDHAKHYGKIRLGERGAAQYHCIVLADEIGRLRGDMAWQPIETAPSDTTVLLYTPSLHPTNPERVEARIYHDSKGGSRHAWATHWMPLPDPPNSSKPLSPESK